MITQMETLGIRVKDVAADGNCLFRAVSDQLYGHAEQHAELRRLAMDHVAANRESYEPFVEDDEPFDEYVAYMREDRSWGGNIELQALSIVCQVNIVIHVLEAPRWSVSNWPADSARAIHLGYHDGQHYSSLRPLSAPLEGAFELVNLAELAASSAPKVPKAAAALRDPGAISHQEDIIMQATSTWDVFLVRDTLHDMRGDVDATIEHLLALKYHPESLAGAAGSAGAASAGAAASAASAAGAADASSTSGAWAGPAEPSVATEAQDASEADVAAAVAGSASASGDGDGDADAQAARGPGAPKPVRLTARDKKRLKREEKAKARSLAVAGAKRSAATVAAAADDDGRLDYGAIGV